MTDRAPPIALILAVVLALAGCDERVPPGPARAKPPASPRASARLAAARAPRLPAPARLVALGDVHGDLAATRQALQLAGAINAGDEWVGGALVVVQTGDQLDRGNDERKILDLFASLQRQAKASGGGLHALNGNHEVMNVAGDFRYVTGGGFSEFANVAPTSVQRTRFAQLLDRYGEDMRGRAAAFLPGGQYAMQLAEHRTILIVGDTVFAHGGVLPATVRYGIERINNEVRDWMRGGRPAPPEAVMEESGPVWTRRYSDDAVGSDDCAELGRALSALQAKRMVVGHTPQQNGITSACDKRVWRIDVGMAAHYGGRPAVLEIVGGRVKAISAP